MNCDKYKHMPSNVATTIGNLKVYLKEYNEKITTLNNKITEIETSTEWIDADVKTAFINTCRSYIWIYRKIEDILKKYISYLEQKTRDGLSLENTFTRILSEHK